MKKYLLSLMLATLNSMAAWSADGDTFEAYVDVHKTPTWITQVKMTFKILSESNKTCQLGDGINRAIDGYPDLTKLELPDKVNNYKIVRIGDYAFAQGGLCDITIVVLPNYVTSIGKRAFYLSNLESIVFQSGFNTIGEQAFASSKIANIDLPSTVSDIGNNAFSSCTNLTSFTIPEGVSVLKDGVLSGCRKLSNIVWHNGITSIGNSVFQNCTSLTNISIPNSVKTIGMAAFVNCTSLSSVSLSYGLTDIKSSAFSGCTSLQSISIPNSVTTLGSQAFYNCSSLSSANLSSNLLLIDGSTFSGCTQLSSITIPTKVTSIGSAAFKDCSKLESISIPGNVKAIESYAFQNCTNLSQLELSEGISKLGYDAFCGCTSLTSLTIPSTINTWESYSFDGCKGLENIVFTNGLTSIGVAAFRGCTSITSLSIPSSITVIGEDAFDGCSALQSVMTEEGLSVIGLGAFSNCSSLLSFDIPESITSIGRGAFAGCQSLTSIDIPNSITIFKGETFANCTNLSDVKLPDNLTIIQLYDFYGCAALREISIPESVTTIGDYAFYGCSNLTSVEVEWETPVGIGSNTFSNRNNAILTVPVGTKSAYGVADYWKEFKEIVEIDARVEQSLKMTEVPVMTYGDVAYALPQKTTEGLTLTWSVDNAAVASISGNTLNIVGAGSAIVTAMQAGNDNYLPFLCEFALTVNKAELTITADDKTKHEGEENPEMTVTYSGFVNGDDASSLTTQPTVTTTATTTSPVGTYPIIASGAVSSNYELTYVDGTLTVLENDEPGQIEVTDISQMDNVIYIEPVEVKTGTQATISFRMKNTAEIRSFQFDLYLPEGVTAVKNSKGRILGSLSLDRLQEEDTHRLTFSEHEGGFIRFLCDSEYGDTFTGNDGEIATLQVNITETMEDGDYAIVMKDMKLSDVDITNYYQTASIRTRLTVSSYMLGDINGDNLVDVSDYSGVASHIHGNTPSVFMMKAADVDESGGIDVSDYSGIANLIHYGSIHGNAGSRAMRAPRRVNTDISQMDNVIYIKPFTVTAGTQTNISICMKNTAEIRSFQFDLYLPEGVTAVKSNKGRIQGALSEGRLPEEDTHSMSFSEHEGGVIRFLCDSEYGDTFTGNDGEIATLQVNIAETMADGDYPLVLRNMKLSEVDIANYYQADGIETTLTIGNGSIHKNGEKWGDVNNDGKVDVADIATIISIIASQTRED